MRQKAFCAATDGAEVAIQGIQLLRKDGTLPNLWYQFRDRPHTTRTCTKVVLNFSEQGAELRRILITGKKSFVRRARYSLRFARIWRRKQGDDSNDLYNSDTLSYLESGMYSCYYRGWWHNDHVPFWCLIDCMPFPCRRHLPSILHTRVRNKATKPECILEFYSWYIELFYCPLHGNIP